MPAAPEAKLLAKLSPKLPPVFEGMLRSTSATVAWPVRSIWSRVMISTGATVSWSTRLMFEPVTSIFSTRCACWACAAVVTTVRATPAPRACTSAADKLFLLISFMNSPDLAWVDLLQGSYEGVRIFNNPRRIATRRPKTNRLSRFVPFLQHRVTVCKICRPGGGEHVRETCLEAASGEAGRAEAARGAG